jgi:O-acetyl-ADP-ribose deacetylase (regulator of RNase III)
MSTPSLNIGGAAIELAQGDITTQATDAIVNAANSALAGGGGVDGAIHQAGGNSIMEECRKLGGCPTGQAKITSGGNLPARFVIHAVGPIYNNGKQGEAELLASAYRNSLAVARENNLKTIAFPSLSTGAYRYPLNEAAHIALATTAKYLKKHPRAFEVVRFVLFSDTAFKAFETEMQKLQLSLETETESK